MAGARVIRVAEKGYGNALRAGIESANGKYIIMADGDESYDLLASNSFLEKLKDGYDFVIGNRFKGGIEKGAMPFLHRYLGNPVLSRVGRIFFGVPIHDFHCGMRGFNRDKIRSLNLTTTGMEFASEMIVKASLRQLKIAEIPTTLKKDKRQRPSHLNTWGDGWRHLRFLLLYSPAWLFLIPGFLFFCSGFFASAMLLSGPVYLNTIRLDIHTLLYAASSLFIGLQLISFFCFAKIFVVKKGLMPEDFLYKISSFVFRLERSVLLGLLLGVTGFILAITSYFEWRSGNFGDLDPSHMLRKVIPATFLIISGIQLGVNGFLISILSLESQGNPPKYSEDVD